MRSPTSNDWFPSYPLPGKTLSFLMLAANYGNTTSPQGILVQASTTPGYHTSAYVAGYSIAAQSGGAVGRDAPAAPGWIIGEARQARGRPGAGTRRRAAPAFRFCAPLVQAAPTPRSARACVRASAETALCVSRHALSAVNRCRPCNARCKGARRRRRRRTPARLFFSYPPTHRPSYPPNPQAFSERPPGVVLDPATFDVTGLRCGMVGTATFKVGAGSGGGAEGGPAHALGHAGAAVGAGRNRAGIGCGEAPGINSSNTHSANAQMHLACRVLPPPARPQHAPSLPPQIKPLTPLEIRGTNIKLNVPTTTLGPKEVWLIADSECKMGSLPGYSFGFYSVQEAATPDVLLKNYAPCECRGLMGR